MKLPASFIADETLPKSFIADKPLPGSFIPDEPIVTPVRPAPVASTPTPMASVMQPTRPMREFSPVKTQSGITEFGKGVVKGAFDTAAFSASVANAIAGTALTGWHKGTQDQWQTVKRLGDKAPLEEISNTLAALTIVYGGIEGIKSVPTLYNMAMSTNFIRKLTNRERGLVLSNISKIKMSDANLTKFFKTSPEGIQKAMAVHNPQMRRILQTGGLKPAVPTPAAPSVAPVPPVAPEVAPRPIVAPPTTPAVVPAATVQPGGPLPIIKEFTKAIKETTGAMRAEIADVRYGKPGEILFNFRGKAYSAPEPTDVIPVGQGEASQSWAVRQILDNKAKEVTAPIVVKPVMPAVKPPVEMPKAKVEAKPPLIGYLPPIGYAEARKRPDGVWQLFYRGTRNEIFAGTKFKSPAEAKSYFKIQKEKYKQAETIPITPIKPPVVITELGAGPFPSKATRDALNSALSSAMPAEEKVSALGQVVKFYLGTKKERYEVMAGSKEKGKEWYDKVRRMQVNLNSIKAMVEQRNREIFRGVPVAARKYSHDIAKGISKNASGEIVGGGIQPAGIMKDQNLKVGQVLPDGRIVGNQIEEGGIEYQLYRRFDTLENYKDITGKYPQTKVVFDKLLALSEQVGKTKLGEDIPAFSREVMKEQYKITSVHPQDYRYVPSIKPEERFFSKIGNLFKSYTASGRKYKTGILAESGNEEKDLLKTLTEKQNEFAFEHLFNNTVGDILSTILEPIGMGGVKPGFIEVNLNKPKLAKILEMKKDVLLANGIDYENVSKYQYPMNVEKEFNLQRVSKFNPEMQSVVDAFAGATNKMVGYVLSNYLIRPSTAVRNATSGFIQYNLKTLTHLYEGMLGKGFSPPVNDIKALYRAVTPSVMKELPKEILGLNFYSDIPENIKLMNTALIPFKNVETYFKRASFDSDLSTAAGNKFYDALATGSVRPVDRAKFIQDYRVNYFQDVFNTMADNADSVTFDYGNKPYVLEKMANAIGRGLVPYPNYMYHKWRMYAEYSPLNLAGANKSNYKNKVAKAMAGVTMFTITGAIAGKMVEERKKRFKELELKKLPWEMDTTGRMKVYSDETVERWLRIYDLPYIGDTVYLMEILQKQAGVEDWMRDSLAMGPLFNTIAMFMGLKTKYTTGLAASAIAGRQVVGFIPFGAYLQYLRVLADKNKRQLYSKDYNAFQNFMSPIINVVPGRSQVLAPQIGRTGEEKGQIRKYDIPAETMKLFFLNIRSIDKKEYQEYVNSQLREGKVRKRIERQVLSERKRDVAR